MMEMQFIAAIQVTAAGWGLSAIAITFLISAFACSVFSLQMCMAYFGEEIPSYWGCATLKLKMIVSALATMVVAYAFLGPFAILGAPAAFVVAMMMIGNAARCDRFHSAIIVLLHGAATLLAVGLCVFVCWVGLSAMGLDATSIRAELESLRQDEVGFGTYADDDSSVFTAPRRNVSHSNPFIETAGTAEITP